MTLQEFLRDFRNEVHRDAGIEDNESLLGDAFTRRFLEELAEAGEIADAEVAYYARTGVRLNGYAADENEDTLDLFVTLHLDSIAPQRVEKAKVEAALKQLAGFYVKAASGALSKMEEVEPAFVAAQLILHQSGRGEGFSRIRLFLLTDGVVNVDRLPPAPGLGDADVSLHVWDLARLHRWYTSGRDREQIVIDLASDRGLPPVRCLKIDSPSADYVSYLAVFPAEVLVGIYGRFGPRLLERNVRSFLQVRGEINKGIRATIMEEPSRFLAYNNGLTATASEIEVADDGRGGMSLTRLVDLQIVNGGQTTASLFRAVRKDKADVSQAAVQVKLTRVRDGTNLDDIISRISKYANSQNKVTVADLSANDPFNRQLEELSRTTWAPAVDGAQLETKWFYERARAQYLDELGRVTTPAQKSRFAREYPKNQLFSKTDVARYEMAWDQRPHIVSRGAQKCFVIYHEEVARRGSSYRPDERFYRNLVAKKILFDSLDRLLRQRDYGGYKIRIVAYSIGLLSHLTARRFDFEEIWRTQSLPQRFHPFLLKVAEAVKDVIVNPPGGKDVTDWFKSEACWKRCLELKLPLPAALKGGIEAVAPPESLGLDGPTGEEEAEIRWARSVPADVWYEISAWAKQTGSLAPWQRSIAFSLGGLAGRGRAPSRKQAVQGRLLHEEAIRLGFTVPHSQA